MHHRGFDVDVVKSRAIRGRYLLAGILAAFAFLTAGAASAAAATLEVSTTGADTGNCVDDPCQTIQYAVDQATAGDTIDIGPGTFGATTGSATVAVDKADLTITGANPGTTVLEAPEGPAEAAALELGGSADGLTVSNLIVTSPYEDDTITGALRGIRTAPGPVEITGLTLDEVEVSGLAYGLETPSVADAQQATLTDTTITDSDFVENEYAMWFGGDTEGLEITGTSVDENDFGIQSYPPEPNPGFLPGVFDDVTIENVTLSDNAVKGIYLEAASNLMLENVNAVGTGSIAEHNPPVGPQVSPPFDGIDINAKYGEFENITLTGVVASDTAVNTDPSRPRAVQGGVSIKSRNDGPTYSAHPASISNVAITGLAAQQNENGLILGGDLDGVTVTDSWFTDNDYAGIALVRETATYDSTVTDLEVTSSEFVNNVFGIGSNTGTDETDLSGMTVTDSVLNDNLAAGIGIEAASATAGQEPEISGNVITGNLDGIDNGTSVGFGAENNWWGCNAGAGETGCDTTVGLVDSSPHLQLSVSAGQGAVGMGASTPVTATFERNSAGQTVAAPVLNGTDVAFSATGGSVDPASAEVEEGAATTTFTAGSSPGAASVTATVGPTAATAPITVNGSVPTVSTPSLTGSGRVGEVLTCTPGNATGGNPAPSAETILLANGAAIPGQSGLSYTPVAADVGKSITCRTTVTNSAGSASASSAAVTVSAIPVPPDQPKPPVVTPIKKTAAVPNSGKVVVTTIKCPEGTCRIKAPKTIKVKIGGKTYTARVKVRKKVGEGKSAKVTIVLPKKARKAIKGKTGKAKLKITVTSSDGEKKTLNQTIKLKGKKR